MGGFRQRKRHVIKVVSFFDLPNVTLECFNKSSQENDSTNKMQILSCATV